MEEPRVEEDDPLIISLPDITPSAFSTLLK
jgi:hypothetical protein